MKLSFSTLGCPDWSFRDISSIASDLGYDGIEIRGIADEIYAPKIAAFSPEQLPETLEILQRTNLTFPILTSGAYLSGNENLADAEFEVKDYVLLAAKTGAKYVRVMGEETPAPQWNTDNRTTAEKYALLCDFAADFGIDLLIETNGYLADTAAMAELMERTDRANMGVIWDVHHTVRFFGETPAQSVKRIGKYIKHVHIKDSVRGRNGKTTYMLTGYGDIPVEEAVNELTAIGYTGFLSYEWVKRWSRELAEPGVAFHQYISYMKNLLRPD